MLTLDELIYSGEILTKDNCLLFWTTKSEEQLNNNCLSQWWMSDFIINGVRYNCVEQYMMAKKTELFCDDDTHNLIMKSTNPENIKELGEKVKNFIPKLWDKHKIDIVREANFAKFTQNHQLREFLCGTKDKILIEASPYDKIWGIGLSKKSDKIFEPKEWKGQNLLGFILMDVRKEIIRRSSEAKWITVGYNDIYDDETGLIKRVDIDEFNERFLENADFLWKKALEEERYYIALHKPISDSLKNFLFEHSAIIPSLKNIDSLTNGELLDYFNSYVYTQYAPNFCIDIIEDINEKNEPVYYFEESVADYNYSKIYGNLEGYNSFENALEEGTKAFLLSCLDIKNSTDELDALYDHIYDKKEELRQSRMSRIYHLIDKIFEVMIDDITFENKDFINQSFLDSYEKSLISQSEINIDILESRLEELHLIYSNKNNNISNDNKLLLSTLSYILKTPIDYKILGTICNDCTRHIKSDMTFGLLYKLMSAKYNFKIFRNSYNGQYTWGYEMGNVEVEKGFHSFNELMYRALLIANNRKVIE